MSEVAIRHRLSDGQLRKLTEVTGYEEAAPEFIETIPASEYTDPARFELEKEAFFFNAPFLVGTSAYLPNPNMSFTEEVLGVPILVTRDKEGVVRAFLNVCRHRGTILSTACEPVKGSRISCPYHAWTYALNGQLTGVPKEDTFPGFNKAKYGLVPLPCVEAGGLIYVGLRPGVDLDFSDVTTELADDLNGIGMGDMQVYRKATYHLKANWKLLMDTMLDKYHVQRLHQNTLAKYFDDTAEIGDLVGPHVRSTSTRSNFNPENISPDFDVMRWTSVFGYAIYPVGAIVVSPRYVNLCVMRPIAVDRTDVDFVMLITDPPADDRSKQKLDESFELMDVAFGKEDFWAAELGQKGLASGAIDHMLVGGLERRIQLFREVLHKRLAEYEARRDREAASPAAV